MSVLNFLNSIEFVVSSIRDKGLNFFIKHFATKEREDEQHLITCTDMIAANDELFSLFMKSLKRKFPNSLESEIRELLLKKEFDTISQKIKTFEKEHRLKSISNSANLIMKFLAHYPQDVQDKLKLLSEKGEYQQVIDIAGVYDSLQRNELASKITPHFYCVVVKDAKEFNSFSEAKEYLLSLDVNNELSDMDDESWNFLISPMVYYTIEGSDERFDCAADATIAYKKRTS